MSLIETTRLVLHGVLFSGIMKTKYKLQSIIVDKININQ